MNINYILNNDLIIYSFYTVSVSLIFVYFIKSKFYSSEIETNNTPTLNYDLLKLNEKSKETNKKLSADQLNELEDILDNDQNNIFYLRDPSFTYLFKFSNEGVKFFLGNLDNNKTYIATFNLIFNWESHELGEPSLVLSNPILITKESNSQLISDFIIDRVNSAYYSYDLNSINIDPIIFIQFKEINIFLK